VGLPFVLLASSTPLLQAWYVRRTGSGLPYRLFALSNAGSLLALLSFPFLIEPALRSRVQAWAWSAGYVAFALLAGWTDWASLGADRPESSPAAGGAAPGPGALLRWTALAALPSGLLLAVTNHLSANVAPIPLLWVLPLALYLVTFILAFEWPGCYRRKVLMPLLYVVLGAMAGLIYWDQVNLDLRWTLPGFLAGLFVCALVCHGELARRRPDPAHLTSFYLAIALGGALGGAAVALAAPRLFSTSMELPLGLVACAILGTAAFWRLPARRAWPRAWKLLARGAATAAALVLAGTVAWQEASADSLCRFKGRNFYGALEVVDDPLDSEAPMRTLMHGVIDHGCQHLEPALRDQPTSYYGTSSGVGRAIRALQARGPVRLGVVGLGAGCLSAYARKGDVLRMYEINPLVVRVAQEQFSFFSDAPAAKAIVLGDARLALEAEPDQGFDLLAVDAFSGDAIPVHLLTAEAFRTYFRHLRPGGVLALHLSNRYLDLEPVGAAEAALLGKPALVVEDEGRDAEGTNDSEWMLVGADPALFHAEAFKGADAHAAVARAGFRAWTDDFSNLFRVLK
jgi:SAM-dependent methyltransferase/uncharacterized membrane protein (UPF0136 family)